MKAPWWNRFRITYGLHWQRSVPCPVRDYGHVTKMIALASLALCIAWLYTSRDWVQKDLIVVTEVRDAHTKVVLDCATQAEQGGNLGMVFDGKLIGIECTKLSDEPYKNLRGES